MAAYFIWWKVKLVLASFILRQWMLDVYIISHLAQFYILWILKL
jgi:hypothetical protein